MKKRERIMVLIKYFLRENINLLIQLNAGRVVDDVGQNSLIDSTMVLLQKLSVIKGINILSNTKEHYFIVKCPVCGTDIKKECNLNNILDNISFIINKRNIVNGCGICRDKKEMIYAKDVIACDNLFHNMILSHGVATGYSGKSLSEKEIFDRLNGVSSNKKTWEICCSHKTQRIGAIGFYVQGKNKVVSNKDLWSLRDSENKRYFNKIHCVEKSIISCREAYNLTVSTHTEHIVSDYEIKGIWMKDWAENQFSDSFKKYIEQFCSSKNIVFHMCKSRKIQKIMH